MACQRVSGDDKAAAAALKRPNLVKYYLGTFSHLFVGSRLSPILILIFASWDDFVFFLFFIVLFALILPLLLLLLHSVVVVATVAVTSANCVLTWEPATSADMRKSSSLSFLLLFCICTFVARLYHGQFSSVSVFTAATTNDSLQHKMWPAFILFYFSGEVPACLMEVTRCSFCCFIFILLLLLFVLPYSAKLSEV